MSIATYCRRRRAPPAPISLNRTADELSVAEYTLTGIDTNPNVSDRVATERAAIAGS